MTSFVSSYQELFLVEAETAYVTRSDAASLSDLSPLRTGISSMDDPGIIEAPANSRDPTVYAVRLWCRARSGESCLLVVYDAASTFYRKLAGQLQDQALLNSLRGHVRRECGLAGGFHVSAVERHSTNGWVPSVKDPNRPALFSWLEIRAGSPRIKARMLYGDTSRQNLLLRAAEETRMAHLLAVQTAEKSTQVHTQICQAAGIKPGGWFRVGGPTWARARAPRQAAGGVHCTWLLHLAQAEICGPTPIEELPPLRVLSFDIECYSHDDAFPNADRPEDVITAIGLHVKTLYASDAAGAEKRTVLVLGDADTIANGEVKSFASEAQLLLALPAEIAASDADFIVGYNTMRFDNEYILKRATLLQGQGLLTQEQFGQVFAWSRLRGFPCVPKKGFLGSSAMGDNEPCRAHMPGRVDLDLCFERKRANDPEVPDLKLNTVAKHYLGEQKFDLPPKQMFAKFRGGTREGLAEIASYCVQDCELVTRLLERLDVLASALQMAFITGVTTSQIVWRGQGIKVMTMLLDEAHKQKYVVEDMQDARRMDNDDEEEAQQKHEKFEGATVYEPAAGMYTDPVLCLDFAALYPSLIRTFTGCLSTYVADPSQVATETFKVPNTEHHFVTSRVTRGIIPRILDALTAARQAAKKSMKDATDPKQQALFNSRQLAIKISANSIYGFTGSRRGVLTAIPVAESTTGMGRHVIDMTAKYIEARKTGAEVVYGDTDSVFVRLPPHMRGYSMEELFHIGAAWAEEVTQHIVESLPFHSYVELEFEKALLPIILWKKKRYAGLCYASLAKPPKLLVKGIELVRRDSLPLVKTLQEDILRKLLYDKDADGAVALFKRAMETVLAIPPGGPYEAIVQSKSLRANYKNPDGMVHVKVARNMEARELGSAPKVGDRVYYIVCASSATRVVDKAEDPRHATEKALAIDYLHYVEAISPPLLRLVEIPLQSLSPGAYAELTAFLERASNRARALSAECSRCRVGACWKEGHLSKDGKIQTKLVLSGRVAPKEIAPRARPRKAKAEAQGDVQQKSLLQFFKSAATKA